MSPVTSSIEKSIVSFAPDGRHAGRHDDNIDPLSDWSAVPILVVFYFHPFLTHSIMSLLITLQPVPPPLPFPWLPKTLMSRRELSLLSPLPSLCSPALPPSPPREPTNGTELMMAVFWLLCSLSTGLSLLFTSSNTETTTRRKISSEKSTTPWSTRNKWNSVSMHESAM